MIKDSSENKFIRTKLLVYSQVPLPVWWSKNYMYKKIHQILSEAFFTINIWADIYNEIRTYSILEMDFERIF